MIDHDYYVSVANDVYQNSELEPAWSILDAREKLKDEGLTPSEVKNVILQSFYCTHEDRKLTDAIQLFG